MEFLREKLILMGVVGRAHGVQGLVRVNAFTEDAASLAGYPLRDRTGRQFRLDWVAEDIARLSEVLPAGMRAITDREGAEKLTNTELYTPRSALPATAAEEFYLADLVGLQVRNLAGDVLGQVAAVHDYGGGTSLEIDPGPLLVPFTRAMVPDVDVEGGFVVVIPPSEIEATL